MNGKFPFNKTGATLETKKGARKMAGPGRVASGLIPRKPIRAG